MLRVGGVRGCATFEANGGDVARIRLQRILP